MKAISRREFLRVSGLMAASTLAAACAQPAATPAPPEEEPTAAPPEGATPTTEGAPATPAAPPSRYSEAPSLAALVAEGKLPPVDERLPEEPLILDPVEAVGKYGGKWTSMKTGEDWADLHIANWCENFAKWLRDPPGSGHRPNLLSSWEWNETGDQITLHFRKGMRWSDGEPLTVDDWLFWWFDLALDDNVPIGRQTGTFVGEENMEVERVDDYTLILTFPAPNPLFIEVISRGTGNRATSWQVCPAHYLKQFHYKYNKDIKPEDTQALMDRWDRRSEFPDMPHFGPWISKEVRVGERIILERNPYYWKVDPEGNQLPYMDGMEMRQVQSPELITLSCIEGEIDFHCRLYEPKDFPVLMENQEKGGYEIRMWEKGDASAICIIIHYCYADQSITDLFWEQKFRQAMSVAIDRQRINDVVLLGMARVRQAAMYSKGPEFQSERGQRVLKEWETKWAEYDPDQAKALLDEIGVVDVNGDGFREKPDGSPLELIVDVDVARATATESMQLVKEDFAKVGLNLILNVIDGTVLDNRVQTCESMLRCRLDNSASGLIIAPAHWTPVENTGYTICGTPYGVWYQSGGKEGLAPPPGSFIEKLQQAYAKAIVIVDPEERNEAILDGYEIHLEYGPIQIGIAGETSVPCLTKNGLRNVPENGVVGSWVYGYPGTADPEQWFWES